MSVLPEQRISDGDLRSVHACEMLAPSHNFVDKEASVYLCNLAREIIGVAGIASSVFPDRRHPLKAVARWEDVDGADIALVRELGAHDSGTIVETYAISRLGYNGIERQTLGVYVWPEGCAKEPPRDLNTEINAYDILMRAPMIQNAQEVEA